jgi:hypothetical protein
MITSVFKNLPLNFSCCIFNFILFFMYQIQDLSWTDSASMIFEKVGLLSVLLASFFVENFVSRRTDLVKTVVTVLFYLLFLLFFLLFWNINLISPISLSIGASKINFLESLTASKKNIRCFFMDFL